MRYVVGFGELATSNDPEDVLAAFSLASCIGLTLYDPVAGAGGLIHCLLPLSRLSPHKAAAAPAMFIDTGVPLLLQDVYDLGAQKNHLIACIAGAGESRDGDQEFKIGERNYAVILKVLAKNGIDIATEDVGGTRRRSIYLDMATGKTIIKSSLCTDHRSQCSAYH